MDEYVGKRAARGHSFPGRGGSGIAFRGHNPEDRSIQNCSRLASSSRVSLTRDSQIGIPEKPKHTRASFRSMSSKAIAGSSSKPFSTSSSHRKSIQEHLDPTFVQESAVAESSRRQQIDNVDRNGGLVPLDNLDSDARQNRKEDFASIPIMTESLQSSRVTGISMDKIKSTNNRCGTSSSKVHKKITGRFVSVGQEASSSSFRPCSSTMSKYSTHAARSFSQGLGTRAPRHGIKNLSCTSKSDVLPSGYSSSNVIERIDTVRNRPSDGESPAASSRGTNASSSGGYSGPTHSETSVAFLGQIRHHPVSRTRSHLTSHDGTVLVRTQQSSPGDTRMRPSVQVNGGTFPPDEPTEIPHLRQTQFFLPEAVHGSSLRAFPTDLPHVFNNSFGQPGSSSCIDRSRSISHAEDSAQVVHDSSRDRHGDRRFNIQGLAEVLLALEQIEQDEELSYEQVLFLETNLLFGALSLHDQHRDMRMDIDNMSYEELLALEEKMGTVSTALTEEQLLRSLKRSTYTYASLFPGIAAPDNDDVKCSICQEEYAGGDEVGRLPCEHRYHAACIRQWLRLKNWCPICKSSAMPS